MVPRKWWLCVLGLILIAVGAAVWRLLPREFVLDPQAQVDMSKTYRLVLWDERLPLPARMSGEQERAIKQAILEFNQLYPNVSVDVTLIDYGKMDSELRKAISKGTPPDVAMVAGGRRPYRFQLPVTKFLEDLGEPQYFPPTLIRSCFEEDVWFWPSWSLVRVMALNRRLTGNAFSQVGQERQGALDEIGDGQWAISLRQLRHIMPYVKGKMVWQGGDAEMFTSLLLGEGVHLVQADLTTGWTKERILAASELVEDMMTKKYLSFTTGNLLEMFYTEQAAIIAPVGAWVIEKVPKKSGGGGLKPADIGLMPLPANAAFGPAPPKDFGVAVFRQEKWKGAAHTRLAMEFARLYAKYMGLFYATVRWGVPAYLPLHGLWAEKLQIDAEQQAAILTAASGSSMLMLPENWERVQQQVYEEIVEPTVITFQQGKTPAAELAKYLSEQISEVLASEMKKTQ